MTRQDYEALSGAIAQARETGMDERDNETVDLVAAFIATALASDNDRFDTARFIAATREVTP